LRPHIDAELGGLLRIQIDDCLIPLFAVQTQIEIEAIADCDFDDRAAIRADNASRAGGAAVCGGD
jgi:hypothetical protein